MTEASWIDTPPFIRTQRLYVLRPVNATATRQQQRDWLRPETFRIRRKGENHDKAGEHDQKLGGWEWDDEDHPIPNREAFLANLQQKRLCLTVDAGVGKTKALHQTMYLRHTLHPDHLAIRVKFSQLPEHVDQYLDTKIEKPFLADQLSKADPVLQSMPDGLGVRLLRDKLRQGKCSLLIDALDQTSDTDHSKKIAEALADFLVRYPEVRCVIAGRPYAITSDRFWTTLFAVGEPWLFAQLDVFNEDEQKLFVTPERHALLRRLEADVLVVPRALEAVRNIPIKQLEGVRTASEIYWKSVCHTLKEAFQEQDKELLGWNDGEEFEIEDAVKLFALLGFEMNRLDHLDGIPAGSEFQDFRSKVWKRRKEQLANENGIKTIGQFRSWLKTLGRLNVELDSAALDHEGLTQVYWRSRTLQDFFAAIWITRYATDRDRQWLSSDLRTFVRADASTHKWREMWRLATEMPGESVQGVMGPRNDLKYVQAMAPLFGVEIAIEAPGKSKRRGKFVRRRMSPIRSNEKLYRCWGTMERLACLNNRAGQLASEMRKVFRDEFPSIINGDFGSAAQSIALDFETWFVPIPKLGTPAPVDEQGRLTFSMSSETAFGENEGSTHPSFIDAPFKLAKYPVTNSVYSLFDSRHFALHSKASDYLKYTLPHPEYADLPHPDCPVQFVDWFDATIFSWWVGGRLPTEHEWEYACRANPLDPPEKWSCGNDPDLLRKVAWVEQQWKTGVDIVGRQLACPDDASRQPRSPNKYDLYDMHGNVWEWTSSVYAEDSEVGRTQEYFVPSRVLRGGSFSDFASDCRSGYRNYWRPSDVNNDVGFRVSRAES